MEPSFSSPSDADDMQLILDLLGDGGEMEALFNAAELYTGMPQQHEEQHHYQQQEQQQHAEHQQQQQQHNQQQSQPQLAASPNGSGGVQHAEGASSEGADDPFRRPSDDTEQTAYAQMVMLQQQLNSLHETLQRQQQPSPAMQDMRQTLAHMQGLLSTSQRQQQLYGLAADNLALSGSASDKVPAPPAAAWTSLQQQQQHQQQQRQQQQRPHGQHSGERGGNKPRTQKVHRNQVAELTKQLAAKQAEADELLQQNADLKRRQRVLGMVIQVRESQMHRLHTYKTRPQDVVAEYDSYQKACPNPYIKTFTVERLRSMDAADIAPFYRGFVQEVSRLVGAISQSPDAAFVLGGSSSSSGSGSNGAAPGSSSSSSNGAAGCTSGRALYTQLEELLDGKRRMCDFMLMLMPNLKALLYENGGLAPPPGLWTKARGQGLGLVLAAAALREEQKADFLVLREIHSDVAAQVYDERRQIAAQLQDALAEQLSALQTSDVMSSTSLAKDATATAMELLHRNVLKERCLMMLTGEVAFASLDAPQLARLGLACYPHRLDEVALWNEIARQQQR